MSQAITIPTNPKPNPSIKAKAPKGKDASKEKFKPNPMATKLGHHVHKKAQSAKSILKKQLRDTSRSLQKSISSNAKSPMLEKKKRKLEKALEKAAETEKEDKIQAQYQYVRFVEQKKVARLHKKGQEMDFSVEYCQYYPRDVKYISLFNIADESGEKLKADIILRLKDLKTKGLLENGFEWRMKESQVMDIAEDDFFVE